MNEQLVMDVINDLALPLIMAIVHAHKNATGNIPTFAQVQAALNGDADMGIQMGKAFLASKSSTPNP